MGETPIQVSGPAQALIFELRPSQPASRGESQSSIQPSLVISVSASTPPTTPQLPSAISPSARPPRTLSPSPSPSLSPPPQLPTTGHSSTANAYLDTECGPCARKATADKGQDSRGSIAKAITDGAYTDDGGKGSGTRTDARTASVSATDTPSPTATKKQLREEPPEDCCVCYEALASPLVYLENCSHRLHLPCYAALRVRTEADLRCPACQATVTFNEGNGIALRRHSNEVSVEVLMVARQEMPADGEARLTTRATRGDRRRRAICSVCDGLVEETNCVQVSCSCDVPRLRAS